MLHTLGFLPDYNAWQGQRDKVGYNFCDEHEE